MTQHAFDIIYQDASLIKKAVIFRCPSIYSDEGLDKICLGKLSWINCILRREERVGLD